MNSENQQQFPTGYLTICHCELSVFVLYSTSALYNFKLSAGAAFVCTLLQSLLKSM